MASPVSTDDYPAAIKALVDQLAHAFSSTELFEVPRAVWEPFKKPAESASSRTLRPLSQLFTGKHALPVFKLSPRTFTNIVSIVLHAEESAGQQRLLHTFINALRTWKDDDAALAACKRCNVNGIDSDHLLQLRDTLAQNLVRSVIIPLKNQGVGLRARWSAAQILATVVREDPTARHQMITNSDCTQLGLLVRDHDDYVLRFLVADILRELLVNNVDRKAYWPSGSAQPFIDSFPTEQHITPTWLSHIQDYLSDVDNAMAFRDPRQFVFRAKRCSHWKDDGTTVDGMALEDILIILSYQVNCIIPDKARGLVLAEYPIFSQEMMTVKHVPSSDGEPPVLTIEYLEDKGFEVMDGARAAVRGIKFELTAAKDATIVLQALQNLQKKADTSSGINSVPIDASVTTDQPFQKRSVALVGLESPRSQYSPEASDQVGDAADQSDTQTMTPLERKAQQRSGDHGIGQLLDQTTVPDVSEDVVQRASMSFQERLRASHEPHSKQGPDRSPRAETEASKTLGLAGLKSINTAQPRSLGSADTTAPLTVTSHHVTSPTAPRPKQGSIRSTLLQKQRLSPSKMSTAVTKERSAHLKDTSEEPTTQGSAPATRKTRSSDLVSSEISSKDSIKLKGSHVATPSGKSQLHRLKRSKPAPHSSHDDVDWDEDIRDGKEYDLPDDDDDDDDTIETRPTKKTKLEPKKTSRKAAPAKNSKTTSSKRFKKPALPIKSKSKSTEGRTSGRDKTTTAVEGTLATRRPRRSQKALVYDEPEDSESQISSPGEGRQYSQRAEVQSKPQLKSSPAEPLGSDGAKSRSELVNAISATPRSKLEPAKKQERGKDVGSTAELPIEFLEDSSPAPAHDPESSKRTYQPRNTEDANEAALPAGADGCVAEEAQDSHPIAKAGVDATAASAENDFELQLEDYIRDPPPVSAGKGKNPAEQTIPFGDRAQFVVNVNALKSTTPERKRQSTQTPTPSVAAAQPASKLNSNDRLSAASHNEPPKTPFEGRETLRHKSPVSVTYIPQSTKHFNGGESENLVSEAAGHEQEDEGLLHFGHESPNIHYERPSAEAHQLKSDASVLEQGNEAMHMRSPDARATEISEVEPAVESSATKPTALDPKRQHAPPGNGQRDQPARKIEVQPRFSAAEVSPAESGIEKGVGLNARPSLPDSSKSADERLTRAVTKPSNKRHSTTGVTPTSGSKSHRLSDLLPASEKAASRTPIIHFGKTGPKNQGRPTDSLMEPEPRPSSVPRQTTNRELFKRSADRHSFPVEDTPSYTSGQFYGDSEANEEQAGTVEGRSGVHQRSKSEDGFVHGNGANSEDGVCVDAAYEEGQAYTNVPSLDQGVPATESLPPVQVDIEEATASKPGVGDVRATSRSLVDKAPEEIRQRPLSNPEPSEGEASVHGPSVSETCHTEPIHAAQAQVQAASAIDRPQKLLSEHNSTWQPRALLEGEKSTRQSVGITDFLHHAFPEAQQAITTTSFQTQTYKEETRKGRGMPRKPAVSPINPLPVHNTVTTALKQRSETTAKRPQMADVTIDQKSMPPPPSKASSGRKLANAWSDVAESSHASILKQNPIYENSKAAETREPEPVPSPEPDRASRTNNSSASRAVLGERPEVLGSTPEPFHTKLEDDIRQAEEARGRRDTSNYPTEDSNDHTLVNDDLEYAGVLLDRPVFMSVYQAPTSTNENSSVIGHEDTIGYGRDQAVWRSGTRGPHRGLVDVVMQITKNVLFRLGEEEDAISAKQDDFDRGGELVIGELVKSWNDKLSREAARLVEGLHQRSADLEKSVLRRGPFDRGKRDAESVLKGADVQNSTRGLQEKFTVTEEMLERLVGGMGVDMADETTVKVERRV